MCKISDKSDKFLLNYSDLLRGPVSTRHIVTANQMQRLASTVLLIFQAWAIKVTQTAVIQVCLHRYGLNMYIRHIKN